MAQFLNSEGKTYFNHIVMCLGQDVDWEILKRAWENVKDKYDMLRTGFVDVQGEANGFVMVTYKSGKGELPWKKKSDEKGWNRLKGAKSALKQLHLPVWELTVDDSNMERSIQFSAHHALYDAQSIQLILADVARFYIGLDLAPAPSLDPLLEALLESSQDESEARQKFWQECGKDIVVNRFPNMTPLRTMASASIVVEKLLSRSMKELDDGCARLGCTMQAAGQVAWARLLSAYTGEKPVTFGTGIALQCCILSSLVRFLTSLSALWSDP